MAGQNKIVGLSMLSMIIKQRLNGFNGIKQLCLGVFLVIYSITGFADPTKGIEYNTENFPPFNFENESGVATGMNTEIIAEMFKELNSGKTVNDINVYRWVRGYNLLTKTTQKTALYSTTRTEKREDLFHWVGPLSTTKRGLIVLSGNPLGVNLPDDSGKFDPDNQYGVIKEDLGEQLLHESNVPSGNIQALTDFKTLVKLLKKKRVEVICYNPDVAMWQIKSQGLSTKKFEVIYRQAVGEHYIAFNKSVSKEVVEQHQTAIDKILNNHALIEQIRSKYR